MKLSRPRKPPLLITVAALDSLSQTFLDYRLCSVMRDVTDMGWGSFHRVSGGFIAPSSDPFHQQDDFFPSISRQPS